MQLDVVIIGSGLVGATLAASLQGSGLRVALVEAATREASSATQGWDSRIYAISPGSVDVLCACGAWQRLDAGRVQTVQAMQVYGDVAEAQLEFSAYEAGLAELCHIVESRAIEHALGAVLDEQGEVIRLMPAKPRQMEFGEQAVHLTLEDGRELEAQLVVGSDGARSWVRSEAGIAVTERPYGQSGVVANFETSELHGAVARQWFRPDGVLALLPLPGNRVSMVWSTRNEIAEELVGLSADDLSARVQAATGDALGAMSVITAARAFPLRLLRVKELVRPRLALIGDAAHNLHPLAGQGVNLGFQDAQVLAQVLRGRGLQDDCGDFALLRRYERRRREPVATMQLTTDALQRLFNNDVGALRWLRNTGLRMTNAVPKAKSLLIHHALG